MLQCTEIWPFPLLKMKKNLYESSLVDSRMVSYLKKIATGPKMSKDLTETEAEDALTLILKERRIQSAISYISDCCQNEIGDIGRKYWLLEGHG